MDEIIKRLLTIADEALVAGLPGTARTITEVSARLSAGRQTTSGAAALMLRHATASEVLPADAAHTRMRLFERAAEACTGAAPLKPAQVCLPGGRIVKIVDLCVGEVERLAGLTDDEEIEDLASAEANADPVQTSAASAAYMRRYLVAFCRLYVEKRGGVWKVRP